MPDNWIALLSAWISRCCLPLFILSCHVTVGPLILLHVRGLVLVFRHRRCLHDSRCIQNAASLKYTWIMLIRILQNICDGRVSYVFTICYLDWLSVWANTLDYGRKVSVHGQTCALQIFTPNKHNSSWFHWLFHVQPERRNYSQKSNQPLFYLFLSHFIAL